MQTTSQTASRADLPNDIPVRPLHPAPACLCGAQLAGRATQCHKCRVRERWYRRNRLGDDNRRRTDAYRTTALLMGGTR